MKTKKDIQVLGIVAAVLLVIGAFVDLNLSHAVYNPENWFGLFFEAVGEFPASFIAAFCAMSIAVVQKKRNNGRINFKCAGSFVMAALLALMAGALPVGYFGGPMPLGMVLGALILVLDYFMIKKAMGNNEEELYKAAVLGFQLFLLVLLVFNLIKLGWGRERYRHMIEVGSFEGFSAWFIPQGLAAGNEFMSFPSGHSANAAVMMWITLLPAFVPALKSKETVLKVIAVVWIGCVMFSRIIMGAHFLSDVTMGATLSLCTFYLLYQKIYVKGKAK